MTIRIGSVELKSNVILAPMSGVTDMPFRRLVKEQGAGLVISEMIASQAMIRETRRSLKMSTNCAEEFPMAVQLAGCEPEVMGEAAKLNEDRGAAIIDINMGCPVKKVAVKSYAGSALMKDELKAARIIEATVKAVKVPVTLKMRTGWDDSNRNAPNLARIAEESGVQMVTVHGRTRAQLYTGKADWSFISEVKAAVKNIPVIGNGDVKTLQDAKQLLKDSGADGVMVGRGAYGRPWFLSQIEHYLNTGEELKDPSLKDQYSIINKHFEMMVEHYGELTGVRMARKHLAWYSKGLQGANEFRVLINRATTHQEVSTLLKNFYEPLIKN